MLQKNVKSLEEVADTSLHAHYTENADGSFSLNVSDPESAGLRGQLDTARREAATAKANQAETQKALEGFNGLNRTAEELVGDLAALASGTAGNPEETEKRIRDAVARQIQPMQKDHAAQLANRDALTATLTGERDGYKRTVDSSRIRDALQAELVNVGTPQAGAGLDIQARAERTFRVNPETNAIEAFDENGDKRYSKTANGALELGEWVSDLHRDSPFLFQANSGGGAQGSGNAAPPTSGKVSVDASDPEAMGRNLKALAAGTATAVSNK